MAGSDHACRSIMMSAQADSGNGTNLVWTHIPAAYPVEHPPGRGAQVFQNGVSRKGATHEQREQSCLLANATTRAQAHLNMTICSSTYALIATTYEVLNASSCACWLPATQTWTWHSHEFCQPALVCRRAHGYVLGLDFGVARARCSRPCR